MASAAPCDISDVRTICVLCWGLIGDVFVRVPTIEALKRRFPSARLTVVVDPGGREVLQNHPDCDEVFVFSRKKRPLLKYVTTAFRDTLSLRRRRFDLCVNLYSGGSSPRIARWIDARTRLGFDHTAALRRSNNLLAPHPVLSENWYKAFGKILAPLGVAGEAVRQGTSFFVTESAVRYTADKLRDVRTPLAAFNLGAGSPDKRWPVTEFAALARHASIVHGFTPLVFTNPGMESLAEEFANECADIGAVRLPRLSLDQVGAVMQRCVCIVTGDTSLMHLAFGLKRPTLVLFTYTRPEVVAPEDCTHLPCFVADPRHVDAWGQPLGTQAIPQALARARFDDLVALTRSARAHVQ